MNVKHSWSWTCFNSWRGIALWYRSIGMMLLTSKTETRMQKSDEKMLALKYETSFTCSPCLYLSLTLSFIGMHWWLTALGYSICNQYTPCGRFTISKSQWEYQFQMDSLLWASTSNFFTLSGRFNRHVAQRGCEFQVESLNMPIHKKITLPLWKTCRKFSTGGVLISNGIAHWKHC